MSDQTQPERNDSSISTGGGVAGEQRTNASATATLTVTETPPENEQPLSLTLGPRPSVRWDETVVDNEGLGRKSSKRCCIFHKQRAFDESSTDSSEADSDGEEQQENNRKKIARPKTEKEEVPDFQRFHA